MDGWMDDVCIDAECMYACMHICVLVCMQILMPACMHACVCTYFFYSDEY